MYQILRNFLVKIAFFTKFYSHFLFLFVRQRISEVSPRVHTTYDEVNKMDNSNVDLVAEHSGRICVSNIFGSNVHTQPLSRHAGRTDIHAVQKTHLPGGGVKVAEIVEDERPFEMVYDPTHPVFYEVFMMACYCRLIAVRRRI